MSIDAGDELAAPHARARGEAPDFDAFVVARSAALLRLAHLLLAADPSSAEDVLQTVLERVYRHWRRISALDDPEAYVRRMVVNAAVDGLRARRRWLRQRPTDRQVVDDPAIRVGDRDVLVRALRELPPKQRAVVVLRFWEDLGEEQTAAMLGCSVGTVKTHAHRALHHLRARLDAADASESEPSNDR